MSSRRADARKNFDAATIVGLVVVVILFCAPLFVGLGNSDLANDEAIYSYAVDRILETGALMRYSARWASSTSSTSDGG